MAYDGYRAIECRIHSDIHFAFSQHSSEVDRSQGSICKYEVITGYPKTYVRPLLIKRAQELRQKMRSAGAKNIIFSIDENSLDDSRWHTGHDLQRENYIKVIDQVLKNPSLGVIFKPKHGKTLQRRLGVDVYSQLKKAIKTGRCHLYDSVGLEGYLAASPPMLAALSADVCIHGHLSGTAAMECALIGKPTLLIDREGVPFHKFYELLPKDRVIFHNWDDAITASLEFFNSNKKNDEFGDWSSIISNFDPFQDEKAAERIGKYLHSIVQGFEQGLNRNDAMSYAAEIYCKKWGKDKIVFNVSK